MHTGFTYTVEERIALADLKIVKLKKERKGINNLLNGYRSYCNSKIKYWEEYKRWCNETKNTSVGIQQETS